MTHAPKPRARGLGGVCDDESLRVSPRRRRRLRLFVDQILEIDGKNPALAARLLGAFEIWPRLEPVRRQLAKAALERTRERATSKNVVEIADKALAAAH